MSVGVVTQLYDGFDLGMAATFSVNQWGKALAAWWALRLPLW